MPQYSFHGITTVKAIRRGEISTMSGSQIYQEMSSFCNISSETTNANIIISGNLVTMEIL